MDTLTNFLTGILMEVVIYVGGTLLLIALYKLQAYLSTLKDTKASAIIDLITDRVVEFAEAELSGASGKAKRDLAVSKAIEILEHKGIKVSEAEILAGIENGVNKLKAEGKEKEIKAVLDGLSVKK